MPFPIAFIRQKWPLQVGLFLLLIVGVAGIEAWLQNLEIARCSELSPLATCIKNHRSVQEILQNGGGVAILALPILFTGKRFWDKVDAWGAKARYPDDIAFQRRQNFAIRVGIAASIVAPISWIAWLSFVDGPAFIRRISGTLAIVSVALFVGASAILLIWRRRYLAQ